MEGCADSVSTLAENSCHKTLNTYCQSLRRQYQHNQKVLLVQIPQLLLQSFNREVARQRGYYAFPPTGLQYLYESIKHRDLDVRILDLNFLLLMRIAQDDSFDHMQWLTILEDFLNVFEPGIVGVSCMYDSGIEPLIQTLQFLKQRDRSIVIAGGVIASYEWENLLSRDLCHFAVQGEGENKLNYLFDCLTDENLSAAPTGGICYKHQDACHITEVADEPPVNLDTNLIDSYSLIDVEKYHQYGSLNPFSRMAGVCESAYAAIGRNRGCRAACTFCSVGDFLGKAVRSRPLERVLEEMEHLIEGRHIKHFEWLDDDLLYNKDDFQFLLERIIERDWPITWSANNGLIATSIDDQLMRLIKDSGCIGFKIGIETGNPEMLKKIKKPATLDTFRKVACIVKNYPEVFVGGNFMLGFPGEKFHQMTDSYRFCLELDLDWSAFTLCQAIRGASAFSDFEDYFSSQMAEDGADTRNFIPTRESPRGQLGGNDSLARNLDVFALDPDCVPDEKQTREIWFTFNLLGNFIYNKNLRPGGPADKFIGWVEMAQLAYPTNPYMSLFLALAYSLKGRQDKAADYCDKATKLYDRSDYWRERFDCFGLAAVLRHFPTDSDEVIQTMEGLRDHCSVSCALG